ncbi:MAG: mitochondrial ribosomal L13 [Trebouxia sp. A1-2]|nr:MAG: mitochondrial ribosomal L13 [Trebouxia sp. A1-2]
MSKVLKGVDTAGLKFRLVDAKEQVVGRLAAQLSVILQGKDKVQFAPHLDIGDVVVVKNAQHVVFTGKKWKQKLYRHHTGFPGGLKERSARLQFEKDPTEILRKAVYGMLPKNKLRDARARKLRIFPDEGHPFEKHPQLVAWEMPPRKLRANKEFYDLPEEYEPMNPEAYRKRFWHMMNAAQQQRVLQYEHNQQAGSDTQQ